jgi:hypothetical protein
MHFRNAVILETRFAVGEQEVEVAGALLCSLTVIMSVTSVACRRQQTGQWGWSSQETLSH